MPGLTTTEADLDDDVDAPAASERTRSLTVDVLPYLAVVGVIAMAACLYLTRTAPGLAPDSVVYLGTAHNLSTGRGLTTPFNIMFNPYPPGRAVSFGGDFPLTQYPPLFPIVLGVLGWLGAGLVGAARAVNAGLFGVNVVLIGLLVARITRSRLLAVLGAVAFAMSANVLINHGLVMSEPLMLAALLAGILTLPWLLRDPRPASLLAVGACAGAASLTRLAGVSFTLVAVLAVLLWMARSWATRGRYAAGVGALGVGPVVLWVVITRIVSPSGDVRPIGFHPPGWRQFDTAVDTASGWLVGLDTGRTTRVVLLSAIVVVSIVLAVLIARAIAPVDTRDRRDGSTTPRSSSSSGSWRCSSAVTCSWCSSPTCSSTRRRRSTGDSSSRSRSPAACSSSGWCTGPSSTAVGAKVAAVAAIVVMVWCAWPGRAIIRPFGSASTISALEDSFPARAHSPLAEAAARLPAGTLLASNVPASLFYDTGRDSIFLPPKQYLVADERNEDFAAQADELGRIFAARNGYIVLYDDFSPALASAADLGKHMKLVEVGRYRDGVLYRVAPAS